MVKSLFFLPFWGVKIGTVPIWYVCFDVHSPHGLQDSFQYNVTCVVTDYSNNHLKVFLPLFNFENYPSSCLSL